ncbi:hypothetical protein Tco_1439818 [Tanacetum coccineum]
MDENPEFEMDNAVWTPTEAGTQAQGMDLVRERVDEDLVEPEPGISSSTYRDNAKRRSRFQQQPVKTKEPRRPKGWSLTQKQYEKQVLSVPKLVIVESQGSLRDRTGVFGCLLELSVTPPGAKAVEGKSVKIDYRVEDGISAIESLKFPPVALRDMVKLGWAMSKINESPPSPLMRKSPVGCVHSFLQEESVMG